MRVVLLCILDLSRSCFSRRLPPRAVVRSRLTRRVARFLASRGRAALRVSVCCWGLRRARAAAPSTGARSCGGAGLVLSLLSGLQKSLSDAGLMKVEARRSMRLRRLPASGVSRLEHCIERRPTYTELCVHSHDAYVGCCALPQVAGDACRLQL